MPQEIEFIWKNYQQNKDAKNREALVEHYLPLVQYVAKGFSGGLSGVLEFGDLVGAGMMGLLESIDRFDLGKEIKFETFAIIRIRGAILDILRQIDWAPRMTRKKVKGAIKALADLQIKYGRNPSEQEIADYLGVSLDEYRKILSSMSTVRIVSLQDLIYLDDNDKIERESVISDESDYSFGYEKDDFVEEIKSIISKLSTKERLVLILYYYEGLNLAEIANVLNVTESRACQLHAQVLLRLKSQLLQLHVIWSQ